MTETIIHLKPKEEWRAEMTLDRLRGEMGAAVQLPGVTNIWTMPIINRIDMLTTGIRSEVGVKIFGTDLRVLEELARQVADAVRRVPGASNVYPEQVTSGQDLNIAIDRAAAARYGIGVGDVQQVIEHAIGETPLTMTIEGRQRFPVRVRYASAYRSDVRAVGEVLVAAPDGTQVPLGQLAHIEHARGIEVPNPAQELRLGMYVDVLVSGARASAPATTPALTIPRAALQTVGDRHVVYLANGKEPGRFTEREVRIGEESGERVVVAAGLQAGDAIVTEGSFYLRAERERLGMRAESAMTGAAKSPTRPGAATDSPKAQTARVVVDENGFTPSTVMLQAGRAARITFIRTSDKTCATEVTFPSMKIKLRLPLNEPVVIDLTPAKGELPFSCGMNMFHGKVIADSED